MIKDWYEHKIEGSIFIMLDKDHDVYWCFSGNELRRIYLEDPSYWLTGPIELSIPESLDKQITDFLDNY